MKIAKNFIYVFVSLLFFLYLISTFGALNISPVASAASVSSVIISAVQSGTISASSITVGPNQNPIGQAVTIDLRIANGEGIWGWTLPSVTWNPQVLNLTGVTEGSYLADNTQQASPFFAGNSKQLWDNTNGRINAGLTEALSAEGTSVEESGVLATLTFIVTGTGTSQVGIAGGNVRVSSSDSVGTKVTCNSATVVVTLTTVSSTPTPSNTDSGSPATPTVSPIATQSTSPAQTTEATSTSSSQPLAAPEFPALMILLPISTIIIVASVIRLNRKSTTNQRSFSSSRSMKNLLENELSQS